MFLLAVLMLQAATQAAANRCSYDRSALLTLDQKAFDQDMEGGWRRLANDGCYQQAADLIAAYREAHQSSAMILFWHEGQIRAEAGQTERAVALFDRARKSQADDHGYGWNYYVDGSIAFLKRDRTGMEAARAKLAALPRPADFSPTDPTGKPIAIAWPINLDVLDRLRACWAETYRKAYACPAERVRDLQRPPNSP